MESVRLCFEVLSVISSTRGARVNCHADMSPFCGMWHSPPDADDDHEMLAIPAALARGSPPMPDHLDIQ